VFGKSRNEVKNFELLPKNTHGCCDYIRLALKNAGIKYKHSLESVIGKLTDF
jgi:hypothetical protein